MHNNGLMNFLKGATVEEVVPSKKGGGGKAKQWNPNPSILAVRLWKDGSVFPSQALIEKFDLEYKVTKVTKVLVEPKTVEGLSEEAKAAIIEENKVPKYKNVYEYPNGYGNGFDVIDSTMWEQFKAGGGTSMLFVAAVSKSLPKVDLFSTTNYEDDGKPLSTVAGQGASTFGTKVLMPLIEKIYGIKLGEEKEYVDIEVVEEMEGFSITENFSKDIMYVPKVISRGKDAGKHDYERREGSKVYGFIPMEILNPEAFKKAQEAAEVAPADV